MEYSICEYSISKDFHPQHWFLVVILSAHYEYVEAGYYEFTPTPPPLPQLTQALSLTNLHSPRPDLR